MSENEEAPTPSDPGACHEWQSGQDTDTKLVLDWMRGTLSCVADCGTTALISALKAILFAIVPLETVFLLLALPFLGCMPADNFAALGVLMLVIYQLTFLVVFGTSTLEPVVKGESERQSQLLFWTPTNFGRPR